MRSHADVVIVGAGPVGSALAAELAFFGVDSITIEPRTSEDPRPRAGTVHSRTLSQLARRGYLRSRDRRDLLSLVGEHAHAPFQFAGRPGLTLTCPAVEPGPLAGIPQQRLEAMFQRRLISRGGRLLRGWEVIDLQPSDGGVRVEARDSAGSIERIEARFVIGADGARSLVARHGDFSPRETPPTMQAIAALSILDDPWALSPGWNQTDTGWTMVNPNPSGHSRVIALDFEGPSEERHVPPTADEHKRMVWKVVGHQVGLSNTVAITRFSDFGRTVDTMVDGHLVLIGDAAHVHYPLGGQGLNTGIQDAIGLGWRLARIMADGGSDERDILRSFSRQRTAVARSVVSNTILQSRAMNPRLHLGGSVEEMLHIAAFHDAIADLISGEHQSGFVTDMAIERPGESTTLARALSVHGSVVLSEHTPTATNEYRPTDPTCVSSLRLPIEVHPDGYSSNPVSE